MSLLCQSSGVNTLSLPAAHTIRSSVTIEMIIEVSVVQIVSCFTATPRWPHVRNLSKEQQI
jgi:hypothetical protein